MGDGLICAYDVPAIFFKRFPDAETFKRYVAGMSGLKDGFGFFLMPSIMKVRVDYYDPCGADFGSFASTMRPVAVLDTGMW